MALLYFLRTAEMGSANALIPRQEKRAFALGVRRFSTTAFHSACVDREDILGPGKTVIEILRGAGCPVPPISYVPFSVRKSWLALYREWCKRDPCRAWADPLCLKAWSALVFMCESVRVRDVMNSVTVGLDAHAHVLCVVHPFFLELLATTLTDKRVDPMPPLGGFLVRAGQKRVDSFDWLTG